MSSVVIKLKAKTSLGHRYRTKNIYRFPKIGIGGEKG